MNDKELRLKVLSILYQSAKEGTSLPGTIRDERLEGITIEEYQWTSYYLIEHHLSHGKILSTNAGALAWAGRITGHGIDIIENLINKSIENVEENKISFISKSSPYLDKLLELTIIWSKNPEIYQQAWELLTSSIS